MNNNGNKGWGPGDEGRGPDKSNTPLMGVCSICFHMFSNSWCLFGSLLGVLQEKRLGNLNF